MLDMPAPPVDTAAAGSEGYNAVRPRFFFVVARTRLDLFVAIRRQFRDDRTVYVLLDRREQDRRFKPNLVGVPERRSSDRRRPKDYWEDPAHHSAVLIPLSLPRPATSDIGFSRSAEAPEQDKEPTMERVLVDEARVLAWVQEGQHVLHHVLPAILAEHDALETRLHDATRRCRALQEENDGLRADVTRATAVHRQLEQGHADVVDSAGLLLTQLTHALEPMRNLAEKLGQAGHRGDGAGRAG
jgi:hypothetical protein